MRARRSWRYSLLAAGMAALLGCALLGLGGVAAAPRPMRSIPDAATACGVRPGATVRVSVTVAGGVRRSALVHLPRAARSRLPLILALHGAYGSGAFMERYSALSRLADREGFAVVYPDAAGSRWAISPGDGTADVAFLDALLDRMLAGGCIDDERVSAVGVSNGAGMAARFGCAGDDRLAGLVAVAGEYGTLPACRARRPLSVLEIHGTADAIAPYVASSREPAGGVLNWLNAWVDRDACRRSPQSIPERQNVLRLDWTACRDGTSVEHLRLAGGMHAWPGADPPDPGPAFGVSASREAWAFLRDRRLAAAASDHHEG